MNTHKSKLRFVVVMLAVALCGIGSLGAQPFTIPWSTIDGGGGYASGGTFELNGTIGQHDAGPLLTGGNFELAGGFWAGVSVATPVPVYPISFQIITGSLVSGQLPELLNSDDQYVVMNPQFSMFRYQLEFTVDTVSPTETPSALQFNLESKTLNFVGFINQRIDLFNYTSGQFETVDTQQASLFTDFMTTVIPGGDPTRFVEPGTGAMRARIRYENGLPFWIFVFSGFFLPFNTSIDQICWSVTP